ncbi:hypothetical protein GCM10028807_33700 [Spirosoma daeguense]
MKQLSLAIALLASASAFGQAPTVLTKNVEANEQQTQHAVTALTARNQIASRASAIYTAGNSVTLQPGFVANAGSVFSATIESRPVLGDEAANQLTVIAYPNPFRQQTRVEYVLPRATQVKATLTNLQGQVVSLPSESKWEESGRHEVNLSGDNLPAGTYIYQLQTGGEQKTIRLIKQP